MFDHEDTHARQRAEARESHAAAFKAALAEPVGLSVHVVTEPVAVVKAARAALERDRQQQRRAQAGKVVPFRKAEPSRPVTPPARPAPVPPLRPAAKVATRVPRPVPGLGALLVDALAKAERVHCLCGCASGRPQAGCSNGRRAAVRA